MLIFSYFLKKPPKYILLFEFVPLAVNYTLSLTFLDTLRI